MRAIVLKRNRFPAIIKARRESFGGVVFRENPAFMAHVNVKYADAYHIPEIEGAILCEGVFSAPLDAHIAITTRCNMYCKGCYNTCPGDEPKDISPDTVKTVIDKLSELGVFSLSFGGGEPTLHPRLFDIATYAREKQILPNMTTNGLTMTEQFAKKCSVFGNVHFSVHKPRDMDHIFPALRIYRKATGKKPGLNILLTTETLPLLDEILRKAKQNGIKTVMFLRYKKTAKNEYIRELCPDGDKLAELPGRFKRLQKANKRLMFLFDCSLFELLAESNYADINIYRRYDNNGCLGGNSYIAIDVDGLYKPCSFWRETIGKVSDINFENWINNPKLNAFRNMKKDESCVGCEYVKLCVGGCRLLYN